jgi:citryl-CoA lyase
MTDRTNWTTGVGDVGHGTITVRGYPLADLIRTMPFSAVVYLTIRGELPSAPQIRVMDAVLCAIVEHGFYAPTTVAARMIASASPESIMSGLAGSLLTIGSITVSPQHSAELMRDAVERADGDGVDLDVAACLVVDDLIAHRRRMPGVGHPLHPDGDPRAIALREVAQANEVWGRQSTAFEWMAADYCAKTGRRLPINVDGMLGCVLAELGFRPIEMPGVAAISFMPGLIAHATEEIAEGLKLRVVEGDYTGPPPRSIPNDIGYGSGSNGTNNDPA